MKKEIEIPKGATIEIRKDKIVIEYEETFVPKNGDFCVIDEDDERHRTLFIYNGKAARNGNSSYHAAKIGTLTRIKPTDGFTGLPRPATEDERNELLAALHKIDKDWDADKMQLVELKWVPKKGEMVYFVSLSAEDKVYKIRYSGGIYHQRLLERGLLSRTCAEAIACAERILDAVKQK